MRVSPFFQNREDSVVLPELDRQAPKKSTQQERLIVQTEDECLTRESLEPVA
jgi:hypothetical protein